MNPNEPTPTHLQAPPHPSSPISALPHVPPPIASPISPPPAEKERRSKAAIPGAGLKVALLCIYLVLTLLVVFQFRSYTTPRFGPQTPLAPLDLIVMGDLALTTFLRLALTAITLQLLPAINLLGPETNGTSPGQEHTGNAKTYAALTITHLLCNVVIFSILYFSYAPPWGLVTSEVIGFRVIFIVWFLFATTTLSWEVWSRHKNRQKSAIRG